MSLNDRLPGVETKFDDSFSRFGIVIGCEIRTDGRTDAIAIYRAL